MWPGVAPVIGAEEEQWNCRTTSLEERHRAALKKGHAGSDLKMSRRHSVVWWKVPLTIVMAGLRARVSGWI